MQLVTAPGDRVGLGWRPELAGGILSNLDRIDLVEVIAEDYLDASRRQQRALCTLAAEVPVVLHGVTLGLASTVPVDGWRLEAIARLVATVRPEFWSEHLAFVRGGGVEIGHLAAPPRTQATIAGTDANVRRARAIVGSAPALENVATLIDPPGSDRSEARWIADTLAATGAPLLLDLHNLYANAVNFRFDAFRFLDEIPIDRVAAVHLAGGRWIGTPHGDRRILDDHLHAVPMPVFDLLESLAARTTQPLTVVLERDGRYPAMDELLAELADACAALARGRARRAAAQTPPHA